MLSQTGEGTDETFDAVEKLLSIDTILEESSVLALPDYKCNSRLNVHKLVDWLHFQKVISSLHF
jgi:hypothetical protein